MRFALLLAAAVVCATCVRLMLDDDPGRVQRGEGAVEMQRRNISREAVRTGGRGSSEEGETTTGAVAPMGERPPTRELPVSGRVRLLGAGDKPIEGVTVIAAETGAINARIEFAGPTGSDGWASWTAPRAWRGQVIAKTGLSVWDRAILRAPETVLRYTRLLPLEVVFVAAETGRRLPGGRVRAANGTLREPLQRANECVLSISPAERGRHKPLRLRLDPPDARVARRGFEFELNAWISSLAQGVLVHVPVWPELAIEVEPGAEIDSDRPVVCRVPGGARVTARVERLGYGVVRMRGLPAAGVRYYLRECVTTCAINIA